MMFDNITLRRKMVSLGGLCDDHFPCVFEHLPFVFFFFAEKTRLSHQLGPMGIEVLWVEGFTPQQETLET